mmetsp:Transcript_64212/g.186176  ORF Transcript_64212/g.186176 Transcript_64212/m.186176 type:complete len:151 (-) Transcript_64212:69-521(-)
MVKLSYVGIASIGLLAGITTAFTSIPKVNALSTNTCGSRNDAQATALKMSQEDFAKSEISANDIVVFSKSYCPYCAATKELFTGLGVDFKVHELDKMGDDGPELQMALLKMTGQKTVPNVFVKGNHVGGNDATQAAAKTGKLQEMLGISK